MYLPTKISKVQKHILYQHIKICKNKNSVADVKVVKTAKCKNTFFSIWCILHIMELVIVMKGEKRISLKVDAELYKKLKIKATVKDESVNEYIKSLIVDAVGNVDLSALMD